MKKPLVLSSIGFKTKVKKNIISSLTKTARLIFGLCNTECMRKFYSIINHFTGSNAGQLKLIEQQINAIKIKQKHD
jgi:hypothetical protein